ncbi:MAG: chorismate synthase [Lachnospiraceae bacterium]|nr:chorismate synthase [Lachnospiraceae bacterium]
MSFTLGKNVKITVSGASHAESIDVKIEGLPAGISVDLDEVNAFLKRRQGGNARYTTARKEKDEPVITSGIKDGKLTGEPVVAKFINENARSVDYKKMRTIPRPSHADYVAYVKYGSDIDMSGGGFFSGRMTLPMCFAGALCIQILKGRGINISAHILSAGGVEDAKFDPVSNDLTELVEHVLPVLDAKAGDEMVAVMEAASREGDSVGGCIECKVTGIPAGIGDPIYDSVESVISYGMFGIPAIKGIEFGEGFGVCSDLGSKSNDGFCIKDGKVSCLTNNSGGIQGGITNGMPVIFRVAVKPTPSIYKPQRSIDLETMTECELRIEGRHDACIVPRVVPCVEAMCALTLMDIMDYE